MCWNYYLLWYTIDQLQPDNQYKQKLVSRYMTEIDLEIDDQCSICLDELSIDEKVIILPCVHYFHKSCIKQWLSRKTYCPICASKKICCTDKLLDENIKKRYQMKFKPNQKITPL